MNTTTKIIIIPLIILIVITLFVLLSIIMSSYKNKVKETTLSKMRNNYEPERLVVIQKELDIFHNVAMLSEIHRNDYLKMEAMKKKMNKINERVKANLFEIENEHKKMKLKLFMEKANYVKKAIDSMNNLLKDYSYYNSKITGHVSYLRSEYTFYSSILRSIIQKYKNKRVLFSEYAKVIDQHLTGLKEIEDKFNKYVAKSESKNSNDTLVIFAENIMKLAIAIDTYPALIMYQQKIIPTEIDKLKKYYEKMKIGIGNTMENIGFVKSINSIAENYKNLKISLHQMQPNESKKIVSSIYKSIKIIQKMISYEAKCKKLYYSEYNNVTQYLKRIFYKYKVLKNKSTHLEINEKAMNNIKLKISDCESSLILVVDLLKDQDKINISKTISYSTKLAKLKMLINKSISLIQEVNNVSDLIWELSNKKINDINRLKQCKSALNEMVYEIADNELVISENEKQMITQLSNDLDNTMDLVESKKEIENYKLEMITKRTVEQFNIIGGKIKIAEISENMINELNKTRNTNKELNQVIIRAQRLYETGKYSASLDHILTQLEEGT